MQCIGLSAEVITVRRPSSFAVSLGLCLAVASLLWPTPARAQRYPYPSPYRWAAPESDVRVIATPKNATVHVDGYFAGIVDDFDGYLQRLRVTPGEHEITLYLEGYRTVRQKLYLQMNKTHKLRIDMEKLPPGETSEPVPSPSAPEPPVPTAQPPGAQPPGWPPPGQPQPGTPPPGMPPPRPQPPAAPRRAPADAPALGTLSIRVKPSGTEILIDGERRDGAQWDEVLLVQLPDGTHRVEVQKKGYAPFSGDFEVRRGETTPVNVTLVRKDEAG